MTPVLEIRHYCLRLLTGHGLSQEEAERKLKEIAFDLQRDKVRFNPLF